MAVAKFLQRPFFVGGYRRHKLGQTGRHATKSWEGLRRKVSTGEVPPGIQWSDCRTAEFRELCRLQVLRNRRHACLVGPCNTIGRFEELLMSQAFFLQNRAHQLSRLCTGEGAKFPLAAIRAKGRLPQELSEFLDRLDRICSDSTGEEAAELSESQVKDLLEFERSIVRLRFSSIEEVKQPAVQLIRAIFADADYFSGLKPLPQYTDTFAYEMLFPSWLNLLKATMLPQKANGKPRLDGRKQAILFQFLGKVNASGHPTEDEIVGLLTFVASRYDAPQCEDLLQRLVELFAKEGSRITESLDSVERGCKDARQFARRIRDYLTVKYSFYKWPASSEHPISYRRPAIRVLPKTAGAMLAKLDESQADWGSFFRIARPLRALIQSDHLLSNEFIEVLEKHPAETANLLRLVIQGKGETTEFLAPEAQVSLAKLIDCESDNGALNIERVSPFAMTMAPRLEGFSESMLAYFERQFIADAANRKLMLDTCGSDELRTQLRDFVVQQAAKSDDDSRFLELLGCATVICPTAESLSARASIQAIDAVVQNRSIGNKEFSDLVGDMRANSQNVMGYLSNPIMATPGKSPRLAALYMTLNEIKESYASSGKADNFSVVRAKYSALTNFDP